MPKLDFTIHKLEISAEALADVRETLSVEIDRHTLKRETEAYISNLTASGRMPWHGYFRADYFDEKSGKCLKLFVYRGMRLGVMQFWTLKGVCESADWSEEAEEDGLIRMWINTAFDAGGVGDDDWVVNHRVNQILLETAKTKYENILKEVLDAFKCRRDKEIAEKLVLLQSAYFEFSKPTRPGKSLKRTRAVHRNA